MSVKRGRASIFKRKDGRWTGQISLGYDAIGKRLRPVVYGDTARDVELQLAAIRKQHDRGTYARPDKATTLAVWMIHWIDTIHKPNLRASTYALYKSVIAGHILDEKVGIGKYRLDTFTKPDSVEAFYAALRQSGRSDQMVSKIHTVLRCALQVAVQREKLVRNPCDVIAAKPKYKSPEMSVLTIAQTREFIRAATGDTLEALWVAIDTGCRQGEILGLQWSDIDWKNRVVSISRSVRYTDSKQGEFVIAPPKSDRARSVTVSETTLASLKRQHEKANSTTPWVFCDGNGQPLRKDGKAFRGGFSSLLKRASLDTIRFHDLRHSVATRMLSENEHPKVVQEKLGHASIAITMDRYSHVTKAMTAQSADRFDALFAKAP